MSTDDSISDWLHGVKQADEVAVQKVWERYFRRLVGLARGILEKSHRQALDEEDVALSAFKSFCHRAALDKFPHLNDRDDLWKLLMTITVRKARKVRYREQKRHAPSTLRTPLDDIAAAHEPSPQLATELADQFQYLIRLLPDERSRKVALLKFEGHTNREIAAKLDRSVATVERKLQLIRRIWSEHVESPERVDDRA